MGIPTWLESGLIIFCDLIFSLIPQKTPSVENLRKCKIISHRGQHDNVKVFENTLTAFDNAANTIGIWGIELDFRWTKDFHPVVFHDQDFWRLYGSNILISEVTLSELKERWPQVPTLKEVIQRYGGKLHLMIEAKELDFHEPDKQNKILKDLFASLKPRKDFHLIALDPKILELISFVESSTKILVAVFNVKSLSKISLEKKYAGIGGHYLLLQNKLVKKHFEFGQKIGVGYPNSKNNLFREINRGVEWIFSNDAVKLCKILETELKGL